MKAWSQSGVYEGMVPERCLWRHGPREVSMEAWSQRGVYFGDLPYIDTVVGVVTLKK